MPTVIFVAEEEAWGEARCKLCTFGPGLLENVAVGRGTLGLHTGNELAGGLTGKVCRGKAGRIVGGAEIIVGEGCAGGALKPL